MTSCGQTDARLQAAAEKLGKIEAAESALPALPLDCRRTERAGVEPGDRHDEAILKYDAALTRQNTRGVACAKWMDRVLAQDTKELSR